MSIFKWLNLRGNVRIWCEDPHVGKQFLLDPRNILTVGINWSLDFIFRCPLTKNEESA